MALQASGSEPILVKITICCSSTSQDPIRYIKLFSKQTTLHEIYLEHCVSDAGPNKCSLDTVEVEETSQPQTQASRQQWWRVDESTMTLSILSASRAGALSLRYTFVGARNLVLKQTQPRPRPPLWL